MSFQGYELSSKYVFCTFPENYQTIVKMYFIEGMPFAYDSIEKEELEDKWVLSEAAINPEFTWDQIDRSSDYLIAEELHPCLFPIEMRNPELMPDDTLS
tara:strand:- start:758 stop:1054 length:297 start_codon:yes stop_codon:yes gene_type:complete